MARVSAYPNIDSTIWTATDAAPALERVLAFDPDAGLIAAVDNKTLPLWIDLHLGTVTAIARGKLRDVASVDGSTVYGVGTDGALARYTPTGNWLFKPPTAARLVFPQSGGTVLLLAGRGASSKLWQLHPPDSTLRDTLVVPNVTGGGEAPLGDEIYLVTSDHKLIGVRARTVQASRPIAFKHALAAMAGSPSGDRLYVIEDSVKEVQVVDRYQGRVTAHIELPGRARALRVDPFGRFVLARAATGDSVWVIGVGTDRVLGTVHSTWRGDVPFVAPDGAIAVLEGEDLVFLDGNTLHERQRANGGASEFWYAFIWNGLRPRNAALDTAARFPTDTDTVANKPPPPESTAVAPTPPVRVDSAKLGFTVSFAALLNEARARDQASKITVEGQTARVVTSMSSGVAVFRVVLGPYPTREAADHAGRASGLSYVIYAGQP